MNAIFFSSLVNKQLGTLGTEVFLPCGDTSFAQGSLERLDRNRKTAHEKSLASAPGITVRRPRLETRLIDDLLLMQHPFQANIPSINLVSKPMYHEINGILLASSKFGQVGQFVSLGHYSIPYYQGTQRTIVSKHPRHVSNGFLCVLEACLVNLELP